MLLFQDPPPRFSCKLLLYLVFYYTGSSAVTSALWYLITRSTLLWRVTQCWDFFVCLLVGWLGFLFFFSLQGACRPVPFLPSVCKRGRGGGSPNTWQAFRETPGPPFPLLCSGARSWQPRAFPSFPQLREAVPAARPWGGGGSCPGRSLTAWLGSDVRGRTPPAGDRPGAVPSDATLRGRPSPAHAGPGGVGAPRVGRGSSAAASPRSRAALLAPPGTADRQYDPWRKARVNDAPDAPESHRQQRSQPHPQTPSPGADNEDLGSAGYFRGLLA